MTHINLPVIWLGIFYFDVTSVLGLRVSRLIVCLGYLQPETSVLQGEFSNTTDFTATLCYYIVGKTRG